jgi:integrase
LTHVRGLKARTERKEVITDEEFKEMLCEAKQIPETFYRLRTLALLCILRLTGKRRSEIALLEISDLKILDLYLQITFTLSKKRKQTVMTKRSTKTIPLSDPLTKPILNYLKFLENLLPTPKYFLPRTKRMWGQEFQIHAHQHILGRQVFNLIRKVSDRVWCHLFRETAASDVVKKDPSIIGAFKVQRRLDLENIQTGFRYLKRFSSDLIERELKGGECDYV